MERCSHCLEYVQQIKNEYNSIPVCVPCFIKLDLKVERLGKGVDR